MNQPAASARSLVPGKWAVVSIAHPKDQRRDIDCPECLDLAHAAAATAGATGSREATQAMGGHGCTVMRTRHFLT